MLQHGARGDEVIMPKMEGMSPQVQKEWGSATGGATATLQLDP